MPAGWSLGDLLGFFWSDISFMFFRVVTRLFNTKDEISVSALLLGSWDVETKFKVWSISYWKQWKGFYWLQGELGQPSNHLPKITGGEKKWQRAKNSTLEAWYLFCALTESRTPAQRNYSTIHIGKTIIMELILQFLSSLINHCYP